MGPTVADIKQRLHEADEREFAVLERSLVADARKGVRDAVERARARLTAEAAERQRLASLYAFERALAAGPVSYTHLRSRFTGRRARMRRCLAAIS